jgi:putative chitinase
MSVPAYTIGPNSLRKVWTTLTPPQAQAWARALGDAMHQLGITEPDACAHFVAQCAHECGEGKWLRELWGPTFAQRAYWRRRDLQGPGPLWPGLGYATRGAGCIQTTGRINFQAAARRLGIRLTTLLARAGTRRYAALMAAVWWAQNMPRDLHGWTCEQVTRRVNGGTNGLAEREKYTRRALAVKQYLTPRPVEV